MSTSTEPTLTPHSHAATSTEKTVGISAPLPDPGSPDPQTIHWFRRLVGGNTRKALAWIYAIVLVASVDQMPNGVGILICFAGAALRFWSSGYLRKNTRPSVGGPYGLTRNPLYLGTYLMQVGASIAISAWTLALVSSIVFAVVYHCVILDEEEKLERIFGEPYRLYLKTVSRFFPSPVRPQRKALLAINPVEEHLQFSWELTRENRAHPWISFVALIGFLVLVAFLKTTLLGS